MAKFIYALNQSLDGFVDHMAFAPDDVLFRHFIDDMRGLSGSLYGRRMYEAMRYWDEEHSEWNAPRREYAVAWRAQPKWVVSTTMEMVGPNATLISEDVESAVRTLKAQQHGNFEVAGPELAQSLTDLGLIDEYQLYIHPGAIGSGKPYFIKPSPPLKLIANERIGEQVVRLTYIPA